MSEDDDIKVQFSEMDIAVATCVVKRLVANGWRRGPSDLLIVEPWQLTTWWREDAIAWLEEQGRRKQGGALEIL